MAEQTGRMRNDSGVSFDGHNKVTGSPVTGIRPQGTPAHYTKVEPHPRETHNPKRKYDPANIKKHFVAMSGEFVGTFLFLWLSLAGTSFAITQQTDSVLTYLYASVVFGIALLANVWVFFRISGGLFNPAVTLGLAISGRLPWLRGVLFVPTQLIAGICASALVRAMFPGPLSAVTRLADGTSITQGLFIETFLTALLTITVLFLAAEKHKTTFLAPVGIGLAFFSAELVGIPYTGGSLNPARSFGPDVATADFAGYGWIYWLGPIMGAVIGSGYYRFAKWLNYEEANPGQDRAHPDELV